MSRFEFLKLLLGGPVVWFPILFSNPPDGYQERWAWDYKFIIEPNHDNIPHNLTSESLQGWEFTSMREVAGVGFEILLKKKINVHR